MIRFFKPCHQNTYMLPEEDLNVCHQNTYMLPEEEIKPCHQNTYMLPEEDLNVWHKTHTASFSTNYDGSAPMKEVEGAKRMSARSIAHRNVRHIK